MRHLLVLFCTITSLSVWAKPQIAVSIAPIHSLVAALTLGITEPSLLLPDGASPHTFQLKPSTLQAIQNADLVVWVGPGLETFIEKAIHSAQPKRLLTLMDTPQLMLLPQRASKEWEHHHAHDHEHDAHEGHDHDGHTDDPHIWLSLDNALIIAQAISQELKVVDPSHAEQYQQNLNTLETQIKQLKDKMTAQFKPVEDKAFLVYHDGYQYLEHEFKLNGKGSLILNPHVPVSAQAIRSTQQRITDEKIECVFTETEFPSLTIAKLLQRTDVRIVELDPLGARLKKGPQAYEEMMQGLAKSMVECLAD